MNWENIAKPEKRGVRYACPCCKYLTLRSRGDYEICKVCFWEDDNVQFEDPDFRGGANVVSLNEGRNNFLAFGASQEQFRNNVRPSRPDEQP